MTWNRKHLLDIESLSADEITTVLDTAQAFKAVGERAIKKVPALRGKTVINLFVEPSTRTRISFELAEQRNSSPCSDIGETRFWCSRRKTSPWIPQAVCR